ncbi:MAG: hypothetical protein ACSHX0_09180 [Akkermansiaceae bacterium]
MPDEPNDKRKWTGLVCSGCRFVFRVPKGHAGVGVICPACDYLLNIPRSKMVSAGAARPRDEIPLKQYHTSSPVEGVERSASNGVKILLALVSICILFSIISLIFLMSNRGDDAAKPSPTLPHVATPVPNTINDRIAVDDDFVPEQEAVSEHARRVVLTKENRLKALDSVSRFFAVQEPQSLRGGIADSAEVMPLVNDYYKLNEWTPKIVNKIYWNLGVVQKGDYLTLNVGFNDSDFKIVNVLKAQEGYLVDWKSLVAWCDLSWSELFKRRPVLEQEVRVQLAKGVYYNRLFEDDEKWICFELQHPSSNRVIYGYCLRNNGMTIDLLQLLKTSSGGHVDVILKIKYPETGDSDNQVWITDFVTSGWVRY